MERLRALRDSGRPKQLGFCVCGQPVLANQEHRWHVVGWVHRECAEYVPRRERS